MDYLERRHLIQPGSRHDLLGNRLVLIAPKDSKLSTVTIANGTDLAKLAGGGRIAVGEVKAVPAGRYAVAALQTLGIWSSVEKRMAMVENVRVALTLVARGEAPLGMVYSADAVAEPGVRVVGRFPPDSHPPIVYPVAVVAASKHPAADAFLAYLQSAPAAALFERYGFKVLD